MKSGDRLNFPSTVHIPDYFVRMNQEMIEVNRPRDISLDLKDRVLYCDDHIIVVNKPPDTICQVLWL